MTLVAQTYRGVDARSENFLLFSNLIFRVEAGDGDDVISTNSPQACTLFGDGGSDLILGGPGNGTIFGDTIATGRRQRCYLRWRWFRYHFWRRRRRSNRRRRPGGRCRWRGWKRYHLGRSRRRCACRGGRRRLDFRHLEYREHDVPKHRHHAQRRHRCRIERLLWHYSASRS